jgi:hypothetical protein
MKKPKLLRTTVSLGEDDLERLGEIVGLSTTDRIRKAIRVAHYIRRCLDQKRNKNQPPIIDARALEALL